MTQKCYSIAKLKDIFDALKKVYLGPIGFEYMHIRDHEVVEWFKEKAENGFYKQLYPVSVTPPLP